MNIGNVRIDINIEIAKSERCIAFSALISRGWKDIFLYLYFIDVEIRVVAKDWMLPGEDKVIEGRVYKTHNKNPKYMNDKVSTFAFPRWW
jgi:hypothetical protein